MYSFRFRFHLRDGDRIGIDSESVDVLTKGGIRWRLSSGERDKPIREHSWASILAKEFSSEAAAREAGQDCRASLLAWAVSQRLGLDLGDDAARVMAGDAYLAKVSSENRVPARNDIHGLDVFPSATKTAFVLADANAGALKDGSMFLDELAGLLASPPQLSERVSLAAELFTSSFLDVAARSRFIMLTSAVDSLLEPRPHEAVVQDFVAETQKRLNELAISKSILNSLRGSINWLKQESISRSGQQLATALLSPLIYDALAADIFFKDCYDIRSKLVHEGTCDLTVAELRKQCDWLAVFVGDLLNQLIFGEIKFPTMIICGFEYDDNGKVRWKTLNGDFVDGPPNGLGSFR